MVYSCMTQSVRSPRGARPWWYTSVFLLPTGRPPPPPLQTKRSFPVAFQ
uniref:Uncharacterized protein n=1 Tax=Arundo donax TaxID=35708 RepID=A0A0A9FL89_ARUDO